MNDIIASRIERYLITPIKDLVPIRGCHGDSGSFLRCHAGLHYPLKTFGPAQIPYPFRMRGV